MEDDDNESIQIMTIKAMEQFCNKQNRKMEQLEYKIKNNECYIQTLKTSIVQYTRNMSELGQRIEEQGKTIKVHGETIKVQGETIKKQDFKLQKQQDEIDGLHGEVEQLNKNFEEWKSAIKELIVFSGKK
jgi:predicted  nucleic acid-binding Zn-ribbon protein